MESDVECLGDARIDDQGRRGLHLWRNVRQRALAKGEVNELLLFLAHSLSIANDVHIEEELKQSFRVTKVFGCSQLFT